MAKKAMKVGHPKDDDDPDMDMSDTDTLTITFLKAGTFCSPDAAIFDPPLPHQQHFEANAVWPSASQFPNGASPQAKGDARYSFHKGPHKTTCEQQASDTVASVSAAGVAGIHVIHVG
jgi:hypothetical protein